MYYIRLTIILLKNMIDLINFNFRNNFQIQSNQWHNILPFDFLQNITILNNIKYYNLIITLVLVIATLFLTNKTAKLIGTSKLIKSVTFICLKIKILVCPAIITYLIYLFKKYYHN